MDSPEQEISSRRKPRKEKKEIIIRNKKLRGEEHVNHVGKLVKQKEIGPDCR